jgi:hypothetical protein
MTSNDILRIRQALVIRKGRMLQFILLMFLPAVIFSTAVFLIIWLASGDITINGVIRSPGDPAYDAFFVSFMVIMLIVSGAIIFLSVLSSFVASKTIATVRTSFDRTWSVYVEKRRHLTWIGPSLMVVLDKKTGALTKEKDQDAIQSALLGSAFFLAKDITDVTGEKTRKAVLRHETVLHRSTFKTTFRTTYVIRPRMDGTSYTFKVRQSQRSAGQIRVTGFGSGVIKDINSTPEPVIDPKIRRVLIDEGLLDIC